MEKIYRLIELIEKNKFFNYLLIIFSLVFFRLSLNLSFSQSPYPMFDELAYIDHVKQIFNSDYFFFLGDRNRMPIFNYLLSLFYTPSLSDIEFYKVAQVGNIFFSICMLFLLNYFLTKKIQISNLLLFNFYLFLMLFPVYSYLIELWVEPVFFISYIITIVFLFNLFLNECNKSYLYFGISSALLYLLKGSGLFIFIIFLFTSSFLKIILLSKDKIKIIKFSIFSIFGFLLTTIPYLIDNYLKFNKSIFYNVNTSIYMWYDTRADALNNRDILDRVKYPELDGFEPGLLSYLQSHAPIEILNRFYLGFLEVFSTYTEKFTLTNFILLFYISLLIINYIVKFKFNLFDEFKIINHTLKFGTIAQFLAAFFYYPHGAHARFTVYLLLPLCLLEIVKFGKYINNLDIYTNFKLKILLSINTFIFISLKFYF